MPNLDNGSGVAHNLVMNSTEGITPPIVSEAALWWIRLIVLGIVNQPLSLLGVVTNIINIVVFTKMGMKDPMNVSLLGMSISDFASCLAMVWFNICLLPPFMELDLPFRQNGAHYLFGSWPHVIFVRVTTLITTFITIERCLCVAFPLKVKEMITTKRVAIATVSFYMLNIILVIPIYLTNRYAWVFSPERNRTLYSLVFTENRAEVEPPALFILGVFLPFAAFVSNSIATVILVYLLKKNAKWRQEASGKSTSDPSSSRDTKVAKMVVMISVLYIIAFLPVVASAAAMVIDPELNEGGTRVNLFHTIFYVDFVLQTANAAFNIFIYYSMSSNYKSMFSTIFKISHEKVSNSK